MAEYRDFTGGQESKFGKDPMGLSPRDQMMQARKNLGEMGVRAEMAMPAGLKYNSETEKEMARGKGIGAPDYYLGPNKFGKNIPANTFFNTPASKAGYLDGVLANPGNSEKLRGYMWEADTLRENGKNELADAADALRILKETSSAWNNKETNADSLFGIMGWDKEGSPMRLNPDHIEKILRFDLLNGSRVASALTAYFKVAGYCQSVPDSEVGNFGLKIRGKSLFDHRNTPKDIVDFRELVKAEFGDKEEAIAYNLAIVMGVLWMSPEANRLLLQLAATKTPDTDGIDNPLFIGHAKTITASKHVSHCKGTYLDKVTAQKGSKPKYQLVELIKDASSVNEVTLIMCKSLLNTDPAAIRNYWKAINILRVYADELVGAEEGRPNEITFAKVPLEINKEVSGDDFKARVVTTLISKKIISATEAKTLYLNLGGKENRWNNVMKEAPSLF
jgi:hypothetical protein